MGNTINSVIIQGHLTRDPELRHTPSGTAVANARIAHNDRVKVQGEWADAAYFFDVTIWGNRGEAFCQHFQKGKAVLIRGRLTWREWEASDGTKRQAVEIVADDWYFVGSKGDGQTDRYDGKDYSSGGGGEPVAAGTAAETDFGGSSDDDIPF